MLKKLLFITAAMAFFVCHTAYGQGTVTGTVYDATDGDPLPGVNVLVQGTTIGASTNADGEYTIENVPTGTQTIEARFVGFRTMTRQVNVQSGQTVEVNFEMSESAVNLNEVVVTGTGGPVEKKKLGNSIGSIDASELETAPISSFSEVLQGREPGVVGLPSGGLTGEGTRIRIRGSASLSQSNEPIVFVDGVRVDRGGGFGGFVGTGGGGSPSRLDDINPQAIERVEILKGAAAATLYGTEASNGVIQIFTKRGAVTDGRPQFDFTSSAGIIQFPKTIVPNNTGFARDQAQADRMSSNLNKDVQPWQLVEENFLEDLYETGYSVTNSLNISGGNPGITYFIGTRWSNEDGPFGGNNRDYPAGVTTLASDENQTAQLNANLNIYPTDRLQFRINTGYTDRDFATIQNNNNIYATGSLAQFSKPELVTANNSTGSPAFATVNESMQQTVTQRVQHYNGSVGVNYRPLESIILDGTFGVDFTSQFSEEVRPFGWNVDGFTAAETQGSRRTSNRNSLNISGDLKATHSAQLSDQFESTFILGSQIFMERTQIESAAGINFPGPDFDVTGAASQQSIFEFILENTTLGVYAQEQIGFNEYIYGTIGARLDANSAFGSEFNAVLYPKASISFIASDAPFWEPSSTFSSVVVKAAIGQSGLQPGAFDALTTYTSLSSASGAGIAPSNLGDPTLEPEISTEWEVGTELGLFEDRIGVEATYWNRRVEQALFARQFAPSGGFRAPQLVNIGELEAQGLEVGVDGLVIQKDDFSFNMFANAAYLYEKVVSLGGAPPQKVGGSYPRYRNFLIEGYAPGAHFGAKLMEVDEGFLPIDLNNDGNPDSEQEVAAFYDGVPFTSLYETSTPWQISALPGGTSVVMLADEDGDGNPLDHYLGKPSPDWQGSFGGTFRYKEWALSTMFEYKAGNYHVNNLTGAFRQSNPVIGRNLPTSAKVDRDFITGGVDGSGNPQNDGNVRMEAVKSWLNNNLALAPFSGLNTIKRADFVRWRELSLTYNFTPESIDRLGFRRMSLTLAGRNLAMFTSYDGVDPEINAVGRGSGDSLDQNFLSGVEAFGWPLARQISFKVNVGF